MAPENDRRLERVLDALGVRNYAFLGSGGQARVYAIDTKRIVRVLHEGGGRIQIERNRELLKELGRTKISFAVSEILQIGDVDGRTYVVERRRAGVRSPMSSETWTTRNALP